MLKNKLDRLLFVIIFSLAIQNIAPAMQSFIPPVIGNIEASTISDEILTTTFDGRLYAWKADRTLVPGRWPAEFDGVVCAAPALADLDSNPADLEILVPVCSYSNNYKLFALQGSGAELWIKDLNFEVYSSAAIGYADINEDQKKEKLLFMGSRDGKVYAWDLKGWETVPGWPKTITAGKVVSPACADINKDGNDEVILTNGSGKVTTFIYSDKKWNLADSLDIGAGIAFPGAIEDVDNDGNKDLLVGAANGTIYMWSWNLKENKWSPKWSLSVGSLLLSKPVVANLDAGKGKEILCYSGEGKIAIISNSGTLLSKNLMNKTGASGIGKKGSSLLKILTDGFFYSYYGSNITSARKNSPILSVTEWGIFHHYRQPYILNLFATVDPFSPNGDGRKDTTVITSLVGLPQESDVKLGIYDNASQPVKMIKQDHYKPSAIETFTWDGKGDPGYNEGKIVSSADYNILFELESAYSDQVKQLNTVAVDTIPPVVSKVSETKKVITPDGDGVDEETKISYAVSEPSEITISFVGPDGAVYRKYKEFIDTRLDPAPNTVHSFTWDGKGDANQLFSGKYTYTIAAEDPAANIGSSAPRTIVIDVDPPLINGVYAEPKVFSTKSSINSTNIHYALSEDSKVSIAVFSSDNRPVKTLLADQPIMVGTHTIPWNGANNDGSFMPDGFYTYKISGTDAQGFKSSVIEAVVEIDNTPPSIMQKSVMPAEFSPRAATGNKTSLSFLISEKAGLRIEVLNSSGSVIRTLITDEQVEAGSHTYVWDGSDKEEVPVPDGAYTFRIMAQDMAGNAMSSSINVKANSTPPALSNVSDTPDPFTPNGDALNDISRIHYTLSGGVGEVRVSIRILNSVRSLVKTVVDNEIYYAGNYTEYWYGSVDVKGGTADHNNDGVADDGVYLYQIEAIDSLGNRTVSEGEITVVSTRPTFIISASPVKFSPNGDGAIDTTNFSYSVDYATFYIANPATVNLDIINGNNEKVFTKSFSQTAGNYVFEWDGKRNDGSDLEEGIYTAVISGYDALGSRAEAKSARVEIVYKNTDVTISGCDPDPFSPAVNGKKDTTVISYSLSKPSTVTIKIKDGEGNLVRTLQEAELEQKDITQTIVWDGKNASAQIVPDGIYTYEITVVDDAGNKSSGFGTVEVDDTAPAAPVLLDITSPTNQQVQSVSGTAENGSLVEIFDQGSIGASLTATSGFITEINLYLGNNLIKARTTDIAGNVSPFSPEQMVYFETDAPIFTISASPSFARQEKVTIDVQASEALKRLPDVAITQDKGAATAVLMENKDTNAYIGTYEVVTGFDGQARIDVSGSDLANNIGAGLAYFNIDTTAPTFDAVSVMPNPAKAGGTTITFKTSEDLSANPVLTVNGNPANYVSKTGDYYTYTYAVTNVDQQGKAVISIVGTDLVGNTGTGEGSFAIDTIDPSFSNISVMPNPAKAGNAAISFTVSEVLASDPVVKVNGNDAAFDPSSSGLNYVYIYPVTDSDTNGTASINISGVDLAGNIGIDQSKTFEIDTKPPTFSNITAVPNPAKAGSVAISFTAIEPLKSDPAPTLTVNGNPAALSSSLGLNYTFAYTANNMDLQGTGEVVIEGEDLAGNIGTGSAEAIIIDTVAPTLTINGRGANPNPFTPNMLKTTTVDFTVSDLTTTARVNAIEIFNSSGRLVKTLGEGQITWDGKVDGGVSDSNGDGIADEGTYTFKIHAVDEAKNETVKTGTLLVNRTVLHLNEPAPPTQKVNPTPLSPIVLPAGSVITFVLDQETVGPSWTMATSITSKRVKASAVEPIGTVKIEVKTLGGALVRTLLPSAGDDGKRAAGTYQVVWDGKNNSGQIVNSGSYKINITAKDLAGNPAEDLASLAYDITIDTVPPTGSLLINSGAAYTSALGVSLNLSAQDTHSRVVKMQISNDGVFDNETIENYWFSKSWTLASGAEGSRTVYVRYQDAAGNWSGAFSDSIILDQSAPTISISSINPATFNQMFASTTITYSVNDDWSGLINYEAGIYTSGGALVRTIRTYNDGLTNKGERTFLWNGINDSNDYVNEGDYVLKVRAKDEVGNGTDWNLSAAIQARDDVRVTSSPTDSTNPYLSWASLPANTLRLEWNEGPPDDSNILYQNAENRGAWGKDDEKLFFVDHPHELYVECWADDNVNSVHDVYDPDGVTIFHSTTRDGDGWISIDKVQKIGWYKTRVWFHTVWNNAAGTKVRYINRRFDHYSGTSFNFGANWGISGPVKDDNYRTQEAYAMSTAPSITEPGPDVYDSSENFVIGDGQYISVSLAKFGNVYNGQRRFSIINASTGAEVWGRGDEDPGNGTWSRVWLNPGIYYLRTRVCAVFTPIYMGMGFYISMTDMKIVYYKSGLAMTGNHSVWSNGNQIWYRRGDSPTVKISNSSGVAQDPSLIVDANSNAYVTWVDSRDGNNEIYFQKVPAAFAPVSGNLSSRTQTNAIRAGVIRAQAVTLEDPTLIAPENDKPNVSSIRPTFEWKHHKGDTAEYKIDIAKNDAFSIAHQIYTKSADTGSPDKDDASLFNYTYSIHEFDPGLDREEYFWKVTALSNSSAGTSEVWSFRIQPDLNLSGITNYPNPFNPNKERTNIRYRLSADAGEVKIRIYDITGALVNELDGTTNGEGSSVWSKYNDVEWDGRNGRGDMVANGIYPFEITARLGDKTVSGRGKMAVLK
jgi:flagellar hook assembly protein FlgD